VEIELKKRRTHLVAKARLTIQELPPSGQEDVDHQKDAGGAEDGVQEGSA